MKEIKTLEDKCRHFCNAFAMTMPPSDVMMQATRNLRNQLPEFIDKTLETQAIALEGMRTPLDDRLAGGSHSNLIRSARNRGLQQAADHLRSQKI